LPSLKICGIVAYRIRQPNFRILPNKLFECCSFYPFGMGMPERKHSASPNLLYRYSLNGQEKEKELNENITSAEYWMYDSRIGKRWNIDPKPKVNESPYSTFANNPLIFIDPNGADTIDVRSRIFDRYGKRKGMAGFDASNMLTLFTVSTPETHKRQDGTEYEKRYSMFANDFSSKYSLNSSTSFHNIIDSERRESTGRMGTSVISLNLKYPRFGDAVKVISVEELEKVRNQAVNDIKNSWKPLSIDKFTLFANQKKYDIKSQLLGGYQFTYVRGVGVFESDYLGNLFYGAVMSRFQSLTSTLTDGDYLQSSGYDDVHDSHAIIVGFFEGKAKITLQTFRKIKQYQLYKFTQIQGKVYSEYEITNRDTGKELILKTNH
jgi:hypothetical protein